MIYSTGELANFSPRYHFLYEPSMSCRAYVKLVITDQVFGAVMGTCVGDALGVPVEFVNRNLLTAKPIIGMIGHGTWDHPPRT